MKQKHHWCDEICHWANGGIVQWLDTQSGEWIDCDKLTPPDWNSNVTYRIKVEPEKVYPVSSLTPDELLEIVEYDYPYTSTLRKVADAAIKRYIQDIEEGDV